VRVEGHYLLGVTTFWLGELTVARHHLERAISGYVPERARSHLALYSQDPRIVCLSRLAYACWYLGDAEEANDLAAQALTLAEELAHPFSVAYALTFVTWLAIDAHDDRRARELAQRLAGLADDQRIGYLQPMGTFLRGWILVADGRPEDGIAMMEEGLVPYRRSGQPLYMPWSLLLLARLSLAAGRTDVARTALAETLSISEATGQRVMDAELHRLLGELALAEGAGHADAEPHFARALDIARRQGSEALEHRAAASLANALGTV
jgi:predicted ATPase